MMGRTHKAGGVLTGVVASRLFYSDDLYLTGICIVTLVGGCVLGSLLPDIDKKESTIGRILWFISWPIYFLRLMFKLLADLFPGKIKRAFKKADKDFGHRGIAHSLVTWAVLTASFWSGYTFLMSYVSTVVQMSLFAFLLGVSLGMISHIALDLLTGGGVALFSPVSNIKIKMPCIEIRGFAEFILREAMVLLFTAHILFIKNN